MFEKSDVVRGKSVENGFSIIEDEGAPEDNPLEAVSDARSSTTQHIAAPTMSYKDDVAEIALFDVLH